MAMLKFKICRLFNPLKGNRGYTIIEMLFVCSIIVTIAMMGMNSYSKQRKFGIETVCVTRLKQIAQYQESFRDIGDPSLNPEGTYGNFFQLQNAGYIASTYSQNDTEAHNLEPFVPYYELLIVRSPAGLTEEPDRNQYYVTATPIGSPYKGLLYFVMQEDGEVYFFSNKNIPGQRFVWE